LEEDYRHNMPYSHVIKWCPCYTGWPCRWKIGQNKNLNHDQATIKQFSQFMDGQSAVFPILQTKYLWLYHVYTHQTCEIYS
jgi:hypothetical protein